MRQLEKIEQALIDGDTFILVNKAMTSTPIQMSRMQKDLEDGTLIQEWYSPQDLHQAFGNQYQLNQYVTEDFVIIPWTRKAGEEALIERYLIVNGLVDIRANLTDVKTNVEDIDWTTIQPNHFGIFSRNELRHIPKAIPTEVIV